MLLRSLAIALPIFVIAARASVAVAWNKAGHMVTASIAYDVLKQDHPQTLQKVLDLLRKHPDYDDFFVPKLDALPEEDRDRYLLMLAARWPDDVRGDPDHDMPEWHYVNLPYKPDGEPDDIDPAPPLEDNVISALEDDLKTAGSTGDDDGRAVALCWIFHLTGDIHQPLHAVTLFSSDFPNGDRGGTRFYIKVRANTAVISLHKFWDDLIIGSQRYQSVRNTGIELRKRPEFARDQLTELSEPSIDNWAKMESLELAREVAYRSGKLKGSPDKSSAPVLPKDYPQKTKPVAERRAVLAGYRLADLMRQSLGE
jgi:hypothetical protein